MPFDKMTVALLTLNAISLATIAATVFYGNIIPQGGGALGRHLTLGLIAILLNLFAHTMTFFYFIGVSTSIRNAVQDTGVGAHQLQQVRRLRSQVFPWAGGAMLALMIAFILGGGAHTMALPGWIHGGFGYLAVLCGLIAFIVEALYLMRQNRVVHDLERELQSKASQPQPT